MRANLRSKDEETGGEVAIGDKVILDKPPVMGMLPDMVVRNQKDWDVLENCAICVFSQPRSRGLPPNIFYLLSYVFDRSEEVGFPYF